MSEETAPAAAFAGFAAAFLTGTFVEYVGHRAMHANKLLGKRHANHHAAGTGQGWLGEFRDYYLPTLPLTLLARRFGSRSFGRGFTVGNLMYAALAAYAHQLQHEHPERVFWIRRPVHYMHHRHREWDHNFGILVDWWDRLIGTYRPHDDDPLARADAVSLPDLLDIHWFSESPPLR